MDSQGRKVIVCDNGTGVSNLFNFDQKKRLKFCSLQVC